MSESKEKEAVGADANSSAGHTLNTNCGEFAIGRSGRNTTRGKIAEKFNTYKFADYKEKVIDLLGRVCRVSVEVVGEMESA